VPDDDIQKVSGRPGGGAFPGGEPDYLRALSRGRREGPGQDDPSLAEMRKNRRVNARTAGYAGMGGGGGGAAISFATGRPMDPMFYWKQNNLPFDYSKPEELKKIRAYCNTPDAPVLMADGTFKPIGEIVVGDEVMGWTWGQGEGGHWRKRLVPTPVLAVQRREAPMVIEATMESGRVIRCTPDHQWANFYYSPASRGNEFEPLTRPSRGGQGGPVRHNTMTSLAEPVQPLTDRKMIDAAGYLSGMIDADGTVAAGEIRIGQSSRVNPAICAQIEQSLNVLGLDYRVVERPNDMRQWHLRGTLENRLRLREWMPLSVKVRLAWEDRREMRWTGGRDQVVSIVEQGPGEVVSMQTGTGNYVAWGYASKNCRLIYATHPVIASAIDVYSKYPLTGMELTCKDDALTEFYSTLFFDQLDYEEYLIDVGREYWTVGEAWPLGSFNETLGVWEDDELINPDDVEVIRSPFLKDPRFEMRLPETLRKIIEDREPKWEFEALMRSYPELKNFIGPEARMPVSNILLKQLRFKADTFSNRGLPILMRGFRSVMQEEMLNAAQDAIASRLYTPLILAQLGASATDLGTSQPWIPTDDDLADFEEALDAALSGDFRILTHHFAVKMTTVFGRENMPNMTADFDRLTDRQLQVFGLSKTMLSGASSGETYAADAINRDLISQLLSSYQRLVKRLFHERALVVAEAQEHYDYEERGGKRYAIMEEVLEVDEETGEQRIVEQPKLLVPDLRIKAMTMKDEQDQRQFLEAMRASGVPISMQTRMVNVPIDLDDEIQRVRDEQVQQAVEAQETRKATYLALVAKGLPIPEDLKADFEPKALQVQDGKAVEEAVPTIGNVEPADTMGLVPTPEDIAAAMAQGDVAGMPAEEGSNVVPLPTNRMLDRTRPPESDEMRASMPKPAYRLRTVAEKTVMDGDEKRIVLEESWSEVDELPTPEGPNRLLSGPRHIGMRRHANIDPDRPLDEQTG
jgi:hypothetical protein